MPAGEDLGKVLGEVEVRRVLGVVAPDAVLLLRLGQDVLRAGIRDVPGTGAVAVLAAHALAPLHFIAAAPPPGAIRAGDVALHAVEVVLLALLLEGRIGVGVLGALPHREGFGVALAAGLGADEAGLPWL